MASPKYVRPGEVLDGLRATDHNAFVDTWKRVNQQPAIPGRQLQAGVPAGRLVCTIFNATEAGIECDFPILKLDTPAFTPDDRPGLEFSPIAFRGVTPTAADDQICVVQGPLGTPPAGMGQGVLNGPTYVDIEWTDEAHEFAAIKLNDNTKLKSAATGIPILWHEEIPDPEYLPATLRALVLLGSGGGSNPIRFARLLYSITGAAGPLAADWITAEVLYQDDTTGELDETSSNVTHKMIGESIPADAQLQIQEGVIIAWTCDAVEWPVDEEET